MKPVFICRYDVRKQVQPYAGATMKADDEVCMCFHVSFRKILNYIRREKPRRASELSNCFGAGTGCGWCRLTLERLAEVPHAQVPSVEEIEPWVEQNFEGSLEDCSQNRAKYRLDKQKSPISDR
jgi:NAD(P)H-nitrite reductase large subunit